MLLAFAALQVNAQYCNIGTTPSQAGITPKSDNIPCIIQNQATNINLQLFVHDSIDFGGSTENIDYIIIDSILELPCGMYWTTNKQTSTEKHKFFSQEHGCIRFGGTTNDSIGQYNLNMIATIKFSSSQFEVQFPLQLIGFGPVYLRVTDGGSTCPAVDTSAGNITAACTSLDSIALNTAGIVSGRVYYDSNTNGIEDAGDVSIVNQQVIANANNYTYTNSNGNYSLYLLPGSYNIQPELSLGNYYVTSSPANFPITATAGSSSSATFGLYPVTPNADVAISVTNSRFRPGFNSSVWLSVNNVGNSPIASATAHYTHHDSMSLTSATPSPSATSGNTLSWTLSNLAPGEQRSIQLGFYLNPNIDFLDSTFTTIAFVDSLNGESDLANNDEVLDIEVTGAYDPNDKTPYPTGGLSEAFITSGEPLRYRIRFQNTGTDTAFNIVVRDTLDDTKFDVSSIKMLGASHNYNFHVERGKYAVWEFNNILLADSNVNEPLSHGYLMFDIDLKPGVTDGDEINNGAGIFFDFNPVVLTNIANSKVDFSVGIPELMNTIRPKVYPNPANNMLYVELPEAKLISIDIVDLSGKLVLQANANGGELATDVSALQTGIYIVRITDQAGNLANRKLLINK